MRATPQAAPTRPCLRIKAQPPPPMIRTGTASRAEVRARPGKTWGNPIDQQPKGKPLRQSLVQLVGLSEHQEPSPVLGGARANGSPSRRAVHGIKVNTLLSTCSKYTLRESDHTPQSTVHIDSLDLETRVVETSSLELDQLNLRCLSLYNECRRKNTTHCTHDAPPPDHTRVLDTRYSLHATVQRPS